MRGGGNRGPAGGLVSASDSEILFRAGAFTSSPAFTFPDFQLGQSAFVHTAVRKVFVLAYLPNNDWLDAEVHLTMQALGTGTAVFSHQSSASDPHATVEIEATSAFAFIEPDPIPGQIVNPPNSDRKGVLFGLIRGVPLVPLDEDAEADFEIGGTTTTTPDDTLAATMLVGEIKFVRTA